MKKIVKKIAMILILVMLVNSFTSCRSEDKGIWTLGGVAVLIVGGCYLAIYGIGALIEMAADGVRKEKQKEKEKKSENMMYISEIENEPFVETINKILETEEIPFMEQISLLSEAEIISFKNQYYSIPELERINAINTLNTLPENAMFNLLQKIDLYVGLDNSVYIGVRLQY
ncbi:MAG: hypothetical protein FWC12_10930 [Treponema sp.]|nr:hypothetical protein [Treponema sp.]